ncbi:2-hydroxymuconate tautomerase family protein [Zoogloea sp.]|uniref:2-hydroxymuconate tautomerase family protein n=1 Tax=Zoogloea sp. TaxID=49181 RepID=UPI0035B3A507
MPFAQVYLVEGQTAQEKRAVIANITQALQDAVGAPRPNVRVWIHDVPKSNFGVGGECIEDLEDSNFPFVQLFLIEGRTEEQKRAVIENVTHALEVSVGAQKGRIRAWIQEVPKANWGIAGQTAKDLGR